MKRFLKILGIIFGSLLVFVIAFLGYAWYLANQPKYYEKKAEIEEIYQFSDNKYLAVKLAEQWSNPINIEIGSRYFIVNDFNLRNPRSDTLNEYKKEYLHLQVYDLNQDLKQKTIDLIAVGRQKDYDINRFEIQVGLIYVLDGKDYVHIAFYRRGDKRRNHEDYLLNLDTEELITVPNQDILNSEEYLKLNDAIYISNLAPVVYKKYGVDINWSSPQRMFEPVIDSDEKSVLRLDDSKFKATYPKIAHMLESSKYTYVLPRQNLVSDEAYFNTLLEWFAPVGEEKLNLVIKEFGTDEQTPIKSYSDFLEYRKTHPKEEESTDVTKED